MTTVLLVVRFGAGWFLLSLLFGLLLGPHIYSSNENPIEEKESS